MIIHLFLIFTITASSIARTIILDSVKKTQQVTDSNNQLDDMINSTFTLFKLGERLEFQKDFNSEDYLKEMFKIASTIFSNYDLASCYVRGQEFVKFIDGVGYDIEFLNNFKFRIEDFEWQKEIPDHIIGSSKIVKQSLKNRYEKYIERNAELQESITFTVFLQEGLVGGISFDITNDSNKFFTRSDYDNIKSFQRIMNSYYDTKYLITKNNSLRDEIVLSLIRTLELYDQYTGGHSEEVAHFSYEIATKMGLSSKQSYDVFWAGIVHDIGKVGIPSEILNKPDRLSLEEYELIKAHPGFGYEILKKSDDLQHIANLVKSHHEWWNGSGYPQGLKEQEIPLGSQIITVADAVSSMATKRPYTEIKTSQEILNELKMYKGSQFSPVPTEAMIELIESGYLDQYYKTRNK
jgi:putative nucleotidyltransferase with HDIG domain